jgi:hypothetical protein
LLAIIYSAIIYTIVPAIILSIFVLSLYIAVKLPKESRPSGIAGLFAGIVAFAIYVVSSFSYPSSPAADLSSLPTFKLAPVVIGGVAGFGLLLLIKFLGTARSGLVGLFIAFLTATSSSALFSYFFASPLRAYAINLAFGVIFGALVNILFLFSTDHFPPMWPRKVDRNEIYQAIVAGGLDPVQCELNTTSRRMRIVHLPSGSQFVIHRSIDLAVYLSGARYDIKSLVPDEPDWPRQASTWADAVVQAQKWATGVESHAAIPDLWAEFQRGQTFFTDDKYQASDNAPFTPAEQTEISERLREIKEYVKKTYSLTEEQTSRIEARLDEAEAASRRMGRKDWVLLFAGVVFTLIVTDFLPPEVAQHILMMAVHELAHLFGSHTRTSIK